MALFCNSFEIANTSANVACCEITGSTNDRIFIWKVQIVLESAPGAASVFGLCNPTAKGANPTYLTSAQEIGWSLGDTWPNIATGWTTPPSWSGKYFRLKSLDNVVGEEIIWHFPHGLVVANTASMCVWNVTAVGNASITIVWDD